jgi:hypothetical protein
MGTTNGMAQKGASIKNAGTFKAIRNEVQKSDPVSPNAMSPFNPAHVGDGLVEGTYVQTGKLSFAEIAWETGITTRLWQDTLVRVAPLSRTVFLSKGSMVFQKEPSNADCTIETKRLQARIHGTTVKVESYQDKDTIKVTETSKWVDVYNKIDGSRVRLTPGVELTVYGSKVEIPNETKKVAKAELIFSEKNGATTVAYMANAKEILSDPLMVGDAEIAPIASIDLIRAAAAKLPNTEDLIGNTIDSWQSLFNGGKPDKLITKAIKIEQAPTRMGYYIGPNIGEGKAISLPETAYDSNHPLGVVGNLPKSSKNMGTKMQPVAHNVSIPAIPYTENPGTTSIEAEDDSNSSLQVISITKNN